MRFQNKKHLGQNFLSNKNILQSLVDAGNISDKDTVLEIGPGMGTLTELLGLRAKKVIAIEKDMELVTVLQKKFAGQKNIKIVAGDVLHIDIDKLGLKRGYKIVANIPYYITGNFLRLLLGENSCAIGLPSTMVLMVQKEVADRIVAKDGKESLLSLSVKAYGTPSVVRRVPKGAFQPPPKVDSAIIQISNISGAWLQKNKIKPEVLFAVLRLAFQQKRKTLKNSLSSMSNIECLTWGEFEKKRPEELSLDDWGRLLH